MLIKLFQVLVLLIICHYTESGIYIIGGKNVVPSMYSGIHLRKRDTEMHAVGNTEFKLVSPTTQPPKTESSKKVTDKKKVKPVTEKSTQLKPVTEKPTQLKPVTVKSNSDVPVFHDDHPGLIKRPKRSTKCSEENNHNVTKITSIKNSNGDELNLRLNLTNVEQDNITDTTATVQNVTENYVKREYKINVDEEKKQEEVTEAFRDIVNVY